MYAYVRSTGGKAGLCKAFDNAINDYDGDGPRPKASSYGVETSAFAAQHGITL